MYVNPKDVLSPIAASVLFGKVSENPLFVGR